MSIVSVFNDVVYINGNAIKAHRHENANAVQLGFDSVPDYAFPPQLPTVNQFRKIRVPSIKVRPPPPGCDVPVKFKQDGDDYQRTATEMFETTKLQPAKQTPSNFRELIENMMRADETQADSVRSVPFDYNAGIKPSSRFLKIDAVAEPTGQAFRP
jgi:hypothetical protein